MTLRRRLLGVVLASITLLLMATGVPAASIPVSVLMPASFADASAPLVREFNASHPHIRLEVTRGPLDTESVSDLAITGQQPLRLAADGCHLDAQIRGCRLA